MRRYLLGGLAVVVLTGGTLLARERGISAASGRRIPVQKPPASARPSVPFVYASQDASSLGAAWSLDVFTMNTDGSGQRNLTRSKAAECDPALSPDGARIAFAVLAGEGESTPGIYTMRTDGTDRQHVTPPGAIACSPTWSPNGKKIAYTRVVWKLADQGRVVPAIHVEVIPAGGGPPRVLAAGGNPSWSPGGTQILFTGPDGGLRIVHASGGKSRAFLKSPAGVVTACEKMDKTPE